MDANIKIKPLILDEMNLSQGTSGCCLGERKFMERFPPPPENYVLLL